VTRRPDVRLPDGWHVTLDAGVRIYDGGATLVGGEPLRALRLSAMAKHTLGERRIVVTDDTSARVTRLLTDRGLAHPVATSCPSQDASSLTVVIPAHEATPELQTTLEVLGPTFPVIVVDDASTEGDVLRRMAEDTGARYLRRETNGGPAAARNTGLREVTTDFVAFIDADVVSPDNLVTLLGHFGDPTVAVVAPRIVAKQTPRSDYWLADYESSHHALDRGARPARVTPWGRVGWVPSALLLARTSALADGFDETLRVGEDVDLVWRLSRAGWTIRYDPSVIARHAIARPTNLWLTKRFGYGTSAALLAARHPKTMTPAVFTPLSLAVTALLAPVRAWPAIIAAIIAFARADRVTASLGASEAGLPTLLRSTRNTLWGASQQATRLLLRHWFPVVATLLPVSKALRRAFGAALVVDTVVGLTQRSRMTTGTARANRPRATPKTVVGSVRRALTFLLARRLDDIAYGLGVWLGVLKARSLRSVTPRFIVTDSDQQPSDSGHTPS
jgi:mycofactocin glycosyltransferase